MSYVIGVDGGTESLRAMVFDLSGRPQGSAAVPYATEFPRPGRAEQDPADWWAALGRAVQGAVAEAGVAPGDVLALCHDTTCCSVVALDADGRALRPALIWMDVRAAEEAAEIAATGDPALAVNGAGAGPVSAEWMIPKALWLKRNEPDVFARAVRIGEYQDYLTYHLTGRWAGSLNNAAVRWHHGPEGPPRGLLAALDLDDLLEKWPQEILAPGAPLGGLTGAASAHLGLPAGLPVIQGGADAFIGMIGLGVSEPGELALITGSSHLVLGIAEAKTHRPGMWGAYADAVYPGKYVVEGGQTSTGSVLAWFKRHFAADTPWDDLNAAAAAIPPGAEGLLSLDHFQGNRTPFTDPHSRGALVGLSLAHTPGHVFRALVEGVCLGTRLTVDQFGDAFRPSRIVVAGGATNSPLWLSIHASTLGAPIERTEAPEAPLLGCAILAAHGAGRFASIEEGCRAMVRTQETVAPDLAAQQDYAKMLPRYEALYHGLKALRA